MLTRCRLALAPDSKRLRGVVARWHPFDRRGLIHVHKTGGDPIPHITARLAESGASGLHTDDPATESYTAPTDPAIEVFSIEGAHCFDTIMPTMHRGLVGAEVSFTVADGSSNADSAGLSSRTKFRSRGTTTTLPSATGKAISPKKTAPEATSAVSVAVNIVVDKKTVPQPSPEKLARDAGRPYLEEGGDMPPVAKVKDLRSSSLFSTAYLEALRRGETPHLSEANEPSEEPVSVQTSPEQTPSGTVPAAPPRRDIMAQAKPSRIKDKRVVRAESLMDELLKDKGSFAAAKRKAKQEEMTKEAQRRGPQRVLLHDGERQHGVILVWSSVTKNGVVLRCEGPTEGYQEEVAKLVARGLHTIPRERVFNIADVQHFRTAMPTSLDLQGRRVEFTSCRYDVPDTSKLADLEAGEPVPLIPGKRQLAEDIIVSEDQLTWNTVERREKENTAAAEAEAVDAAQRRSDREEHELRASFLDEDEAAPEGRLYGVIVRWSGGQGVVEWTKGRLFYIESASEFVQLVDPHTQHLRGAVVEFHVEQGSPRYAKGVSLLSAMLGSSSPVASRPPGQESTAKVSSVEDNGAAPEQTAAAAPDESDASWQEGRLMMWSAAEEQGIVKIDDGTRFVLQDAGAVIHGFADAKGTLKKGAKIRFIAGGATGKVVQHALVPAPDPTEEDADLDAEGGAEGTRRESISSVREGRGGTGEEEGKANPTSMDKEALGVNSDYWIRRMEKSGFDVNEYKKLKDSIVPPSHEDVNLNMLEEDPWYNDPSKNQKIPGTDVKRGDMYKVGPAAMVDLAMRTKDPDLLQKTKKKIEDKLTPEQHDYAMRKAKEQAPKFLDFLKKSNQIGSETAVETKHGFF